MNRLLYTLFLMISFTLSAQHDVKWGMEFKDAKRSDAIDFIGVDQQGNSYVLKRGKFKKSHLAVAKLDKDMNQVLSKPVLLKEGKKKKYFEDITFVKDRLTLFTSSLNTQEKLNVLNMEEMDLNKFLLQSPSKEINRISYEGYSKRNSGFYSFVESRNKEMILMYHQNPSKKKELQKYGLKIMSADKELLWEKEVNLPYRDDLFKMEWLKIDNYGNVYMLGKLYFEKARAEVKGKINYEYQLRKYAPNGAEEMVKIDHKGNHLKQMQIEVNRNKDLICSGFYSSDADRAAKGCYYMLLDGNDMTVKTTAFNEFSLEFMKKHTSRRTAKKMDKKAKKGKEVELYNIYVDELIVRDDGGVVVIGEKYYVRVVTTTMTNSNGTTTTRTTYHYYYNDILVININPDGSIAWAEQVGKKQHTINDSGIYSSYELAVNKDKLYFIFNDNANNINAKEGEGLYYFNKSKSSLAVVVEMDGEGNQKKTRLFSAREAGVLIKPQVCEQVSKNEVLLYGKMRKKMRFAKLIL